MLFLFLTTNLDPYHRLFKHSHISPLHMLHLEKKNKMRAQKRLRESQNLRNFWHQAGRILPDPYLKPQNCRWFTVFQLPSWSFLLKASWMLSNTSFATRHVGWSLYMLPTLGRQMKYTYLCIRNQTLLVVSNLYISLHWIWRQTSIFLHLHAVMRFGQEL